MPAVNDHASAPSETGIWVTLAAITMSFAAFTSALIVRQGAAPDWYHLTLPNILFWNTLGTAGQTRDDTSDSDDSAGKDW